MDDPYQTPQAELAVTPARGRPGDPELASLGSRLGGAMIDDLVAAVVALVVITGALTLYQQGHLHLRPQQLLGGMLGVGSLLLLLIQLPFLLGDSQTLGKRVAGTRIVRMDGKKPSPLQIARRCGLYLLMIGWSWLEWQVRGDQMLEWLAVLGMLVPLLVRVTLGRVVDGLMILSSERRCLHDYMAGTRVVRVREEHRTSNVQHRTSK